MARRLRSRAARGGFLPSPRVLLLLLILLIALAARLRGLGYGLPALYDPDEPLFLISGLRLIGKHTLDPAWFGHPGTTTIYALALIDIAIFLFGHLAGLYRNAAAFGLAVYLDPSFVALPSRLFIVLCALICIVLTWQLGRRLFDDRIGLVAALLVAINPLHVQYSQIIRTDVHATVFMLLAAIASVSIAARGPARDYLLAGIAIGLATATKWPAATIAAAPLGACLLRAKNDPADARRQLRLLLLSAVVAVVTLIVTSPYLVIDHQRLLDNLHGERRPAHLGATGGGFGWNLGWYLAGPLRQSVGWLGLGLGAVGLALGGRRSPVFLAVVAFPVLVFLVAVSAQALIWARWIVPLLPFVSIAVAAGLVLAVEQVGARGRLPFAALLSALLVVPMAAAVQAEGTERLHDTRALASRWILSHVPPGRTILVEHFAFDLLHHNWRILFPGGETGCIDAVATLTGQVQSTTIDSWRNGRAIMDIGTIDPARLDTCRADYAVFSYYDRYRAEAGGFAAERANYARLLAKGKVVARFEPVAGRIGGPGVEIVRLGQSRPVPADQAKPAAVR